MIKKTKKMGQMAKSLQNPDAADEIYKLIKNLMES